MDGHILLFCPRPLPAGELHGMGKFASCDMAWGVLEPQY